MSKYPPREELAPLGALCLDYTDDIHRPPGDPLNEVSFNFPVIREMVQQATLWNIVATDEYTEEFLDCFVDACNKLEKRGAIGIITSCGFLAQIQTRLAAKINIPIATSSLLQVPFVLNIISPTKKIGILTFESTVLGKAHFKGIGVTEEMQQRLVIAGAREEGPLRAIIARGAPYIQEELCQELVDLAMELLSANPDIGAFVLECTQMPIASLAIQKATGLPVYDAITMIDWFYSGLKARILPADEFAEEGKRPRLRSEKEKR